MKDILRVLVLVLAGYWLYSYFIAQGESNSASDNLEFDTAARCIEKLNSAGERLGSAIRRFGTPPIDREAWDEEYQQLEQRTDLAEAACTCKGEACYKAREAHRQLRSLIVDYNGGMTSNTGPPAGAAARLNKFQRTVEAAKALDR